MERGPGGEVSWSMTMPDEPKWIVRRFNWRALVTPSEGTRYVRLPGAFTVAEFDEREDAEADCWNRERAVRAAVNPFRCGFDLADLTHIPDFAFKDYLMDDSIRPAKYDSTARIRWDKWWEKHSSAWNDDRKARIWEALDKVRFFELVGRPGDQEVFVAVEAVTNFTPVPIWDRWRYVASEYGSEGGRPVRAFRSREDADAYLELVAEATDVPERIQYDPDPFTPNAPAKVPADRVYDVPLDGEPTTPATVFVVCRVGLTDTAFWHGIRHIGWGFDTYPTGEVRWVEGHPDYDVFPSRYAVRNPRLVPEAAFTTREAAEAEILVRERAARRWLNPYVVYDFRRSQGSNPERQARWWSATYANAPDKEHDEVWAMFPHEHLYHVVETELED
jgi:hypothetical protein